MSVLKLKQNFWLVIVITFLLTAPWLTQAAGLVPCGGPTEHPCNVEDMFFGVARVTNWLFMVAGIVAVYEIVAGAFWLTISRGNEENITKYRKAIINAVVGFVFVMLAYVLVNTVANLILANGNCKYQIDLKNPFNYIQEKDNCK